MKCPKCGYNSFEYHGSCKKCSADLGVYKQTYNITPIVLPPEAREIKNDEFRSTPSAAEQPVDKIEANDDMFSFDLPVESARPYPAALQNDEPFNFDNDLPEVNPQQSMIGADGFADLLESTSSVADNPFASYEPPSPTPSLKPAVSTSGSGEFDLENFSWDDTPVATTTSGEQTGNDDFDNLFGDSKETTK